MATWPSACSHRSSKGRYLHATANSNRERSTRKAARRSRGTSSLCLKDSARRIFWSKLKSRGRSRSRTRPSTRRTE